MAEIFFNKNKNTTNRSRIILVEGPDDAYFLESVLLEIGADPESISICIARGKDRMEVTLGSILKSSDFTQERIKGYAIIMDADDSAQNSTLELHKVLTRLGEPNPPAGGFTNRQDGRKLGLYLFPDNSTAGDLETLCLSTIQSSPLKTHAETFANTAPGGQADHLRKRQNQAYLSVASNPMCAGAGWASTRGVYDLKSATLDNLKAFLRTLLT